MKPFSVSFCFLISSLVSVGFLILRTETHWRSRCSSMAKLLVLEHQLLSTSLHHLFYTPHSHCIFLAFWSNGLGWKSSCLCFISGYVFFITPLLLTECNLFFFQHRFCGHFKALFCHERLKVTRVPRECSTLTVRLRHCIQLICMNVGLLVF